MDTDVGYMEARRLLDKDYGDPYKLSMVYIQKIQEWSTLKAGDNSVLKQFALFLKKCSTEMKGISYLSVRNHPPNMLYCGTKVASLFAEQMSFSYEQDAALAEGHWV